VIGAGADRLGDAVEDPRPLDPRDVGPRAVIEGLAGGRDRPGEMLDPHRRIASHHDVMRRARALGNPSVSGVDPLAVNEILIVAGGYGLGHEGSSLLETRDARPARAAATREIRRATAWVRSAGSISDCGSGGGPRTRAAPEP